MSKRIDRAFNNCYCLCDHCGHEMTVDETDYSRISKELRSYGWIIARINGSYYDFCSSECYTKSKVE